MRRIALFSSVASIAVIVACVGTDESSSGGGACTDPSCAEAGSSDGPSGADGSGPDDSSNTKSILVAIDPSDLTITQGATASIKVDVQRVGVTTPIHVEITGLPATILEGTLTIAPDATTGTVVLSAQATAVQTKTPIALTLTARAESGETASKPVTLTVNGAPGTLDVDFGTNGKIVQAFGTGTDIARCVLFDSSKRLYVGGNSANGPVVARYTSDGKLDTTFAAPNGYVTGPAMFTEACTIQSDGKIVFAGSFNADLAVSRVNADGTIDMAFGTSGRVTSDFGGTERGTGVVVLPDATIVATGFTQTATPTYKFIAQRVSSAGVAGTKSALTGVQTVDQASGAALAMNGDVLVNGASAPSFLISDVSAAMIQALDPASLARDTAGYGSPQGYTIDGTYGTGQFYGGGAAVQKDGKIVLVGGGYSNGVSVLSTFRVLRYSKTGPADTTFNTTGHASITVGTASSAASAVAIQADGKIVITGTAQATAPEQADFGVIRLAADGTPDTTFHGDGQLIVPMQSATADTPYAIGIQQDGRIVVVGQTLTGPGNFDWAIMRVWP